MRFIAGFDLLVGAGVALCAVCFYRRDDGAWDWQTAASFAVHVVYALACGLAAYHLLCGRPAKAVAPQWVAAGCQWAITAVLAYECVGDTPMRTMFLVITGIAGAVALALSVSAGYVYYVARETAESRSDAGQ